MAYGDAKFKIAKFKTKGWVGSECMTNSSKFELFFGCVLPDTQADVVPDVGQRDIFSLKGLSLLLELMCKTDPPAFLGHSVSHFLGDISAHEVRWGLLTPVCSHFGRRATSSVDLYVKRGGDLAGGGTEQLLSTDLSPPFVNKRLDLWCTTLRWWLAASSLELSVAQWTAKSHSRGESRTSPVKLWKDRPMTKQLFLQVWIPNAIMRWLLSSYLQGLIAPICLSNSL